MDPNQNQGTPVDPNQGGGGGAPVDQPPAQPVPEPTAQPETPVTETPPATEEQGGGTPVGGAPAM